MSDSSPVERLKAAIEAKRKPSFAGGGEVLRDLRAATAWNDALAAVLALPEWAGLEGPRAVEASDSTAARQPPSRAEQIVAAEKAIKHVRALLRAPLASRWWEQIAAEIKKLPRYCVWSNLAVSRQSETFVEQSSSQIETVSLDAVLARLAAQSAETPETTYFLTKQRSNHDCYEFDYRVGAREPGVMERYVGVIYRLAEAERVVNALNQLSAQPAAEDDRETSLVCDTCGEPEEGYPHPAMKCGKPDCVGTLRQPATEDDRPRLIAALRAVTTTGDDCPMCDRGRLRNPQKTHWPECAFGKAQALLSELERALPPAAKEGR